MQHEWNEALAATIGKIGLCINAMGSLFAFLLEQMQFEPTAVNISVFIGFCGLLLQIFVQVHAWKQRNAQNAALQRKLEKVADLPGRLRTMRLGSAWEDSNWA